MTEDRTLPYPYLICDEPDAHGIACTGIVLRDSDNMDRCSAHYAKRFGQPLETKGDM